MYVSNTDYVYILVFVTFIDTIYIGFSISICINIYIKIRIIS
ncbi:hypothetical protein SAMN05216391_11126 [Lachnospiraceae bacterium KHCPX20]|nr:hypothetical protein SAMN05216391_11126 [Lachnospiraceae bacterium KHCPX20]